MTTVDVSWDILCSAKGTCLDYCKPYRSTTRVMVWDVISYDIQTHRVIIFGTVAAQLYLDEILQPIMLPLFLRHLGITFQHIIPAAFGTYCYELFSYLPYTSLANLDFRSLSHRGCSHIWGVMRRRLEPFWNIDYLALANLLRGFWSLAYPMNFCKLSTTLQII